jgi:ABC-type transport system involved in cytochrome c biogenesis ATPase subunit
MSIERLNTEQRAIFAHIMQVINSGEQLLAYIDGRAGRGKTYLINAVISLLRSRQAIVIPTATSAFAAQLYPGGRTTHSAFKVSSSMQVLYSEN